MGQKGTYKGRPVFDTGEEAQRYANRTGDSAYYYHGKYWRKNWGDQAVELVEPSRSPASEVQETVRSLLREPESFSHWLAQGAGRNVPDVKLDQGFYDIIDLIKSPTSGVHEAIFNYGEGGRYLPWYYPEAEQASRERWMRDVYNRIPDLYAAPGKSPHSGAAKAAAALALSRFNEAENQNRYAAAQQAFAQALQATQQATQLYQVEHAAREADLMRKIEVWAKEQGFNFQAVADALQAEGLGLNYELQGEQLDLQREQFAWQKKQASKRGGPEGLLGALGGAGVGALVGNMIVPGAGTLIGAQLGSTLGGAAGTYIGGGQVSPAVVPATFGSLQSWQTMQQQQQFQNQLLANLLSSPDVDTSLALTTGVPSTTPAYLMYTPGTGQYASPWGGGVQLQLGP